MDKLQIMKDFSEIIDRFMCRMAEIDSFRRIALCSIETSSPSEVRYQTNLFYYFLYNPEYDSMFSDKQGFVEHMKKDNLAFQSAEMTIKKCLQTIDNSSIVFLHSVFEDSLYKLSLIVSELKPELFDKFIKDREYKVKLKQIDELMNRNLWGEQRSKFLRELERDSLINKIKVLFEICPNHTPGQIQMRNYMYNEQRIKRIDEIRHNIVHNGVTVPEELCIIDEIDYIRKTFVFFFFCVAKNHGLKIIAKQHE